MFRNWSFGCTQAYSGKHPPVITRLQTTALPHRTFQPFRLLGASALSAVALALSCSLSAHAQQLSGLVVRIADGDTLTILVGERQVRIRLAEIDAPEKAQPFGTRSRQSLAEMCFQKQALVQTVDRDRYDRTVGRVKCAGVDANSEQVKRGMAWVYRQYAKRAFQLYDLEDEAKAAKRGLWADQAPVPPWEWRKDRR